MRLKCDTGEVSYELRRGGIGTLPSSWRQDSGEAGESESDSDALTINDCND